MCIRDSVHPEPCSPRRPPPRQQLDLSRDISRDTLLRPVHHTLQRQVDLSRHRRNRTKPSQRPSAGTKLRRDISFDVLGRPVHQGTFPKSLQRKVHKAQLSRGMQNAWERTTSDADMQAALDMDIRRITQSLSPSGSPTHCDM
eukprot:TRINITY_DN16312_c0_g1_i1.p1 TRINITY_DN16312_c0_g1~~TRINITY_DN16312_c0_g1_i1.p1  ORF type:complete len:143 (-),score=8.85 TRINITY_DN16312_c0_g1_i1:218-646(-)